MSVHGPDRKDSGHRFVQGVYAVIFSRDPHLPIHQFRLNCSFYDYYDPANISDWVNAALQHRVHHLDLCLPALWQQQQTPNLSSIFTCKTLVVLKLGECNLELTSSVDLPFLKVMHLHDLRFSKCAYLAQLLSGCPLLEDFKATDSRFHKYVIDTEFKTLPKLLRAHLSTITKMFLLGAVSNVKFLRIDGIVRRLGESTRPYVFLFPMFHNLTHIELEYNNYNYDWSDVVEFLQYCPMLQALVINQPRLSVYVSQLSKYPAIWQYPPSVPKCILLHLKSCCLNHYIGANGEFQFARYIMQNGSFLEGMTICSDITVKEQGKLKMLEKLSSCTRSSATCKLSFK